MRSDLLTAGALALAFSVVSAATAADKNQPLKPATADYDALYAHYLETARSTTVAAGVPRWMDSLLVDPRAHAANDLLTVKVVESINATGSADAQVNKASTGALSLANLFGIESKLPSAVNPANLVNSASTTTFKGNGSTTRNGTLTANITVRIAEVLPNGYLVLEGAREIDINGDRQMLVLTGVVRPDDIAPGNVVLSTSIGQLRVQYFGNGLIKDSLAPGFLMRVFNKIF